MRDKLIFLICFLFTQSVFAEVYYVEVNAVTGKRVSMSKEESIPVNTSTSIYIEITQQDYDSMNSADYVESQTQYTNWYKKQENKDKVDTAIANKPKTTEEKIAELQAQLDALNTTP